MLLSCLGLLAGEKPNLSGPVGALFQIPSLCSLQDAHIFVHEVLGELPRGAKVDEVHLVKERRKKKKKNI